MKNTISLFAFLILSFSLWGCDPWGGALPENVLARINEEEITFDEFDREFKEAILEPHWRKTSEVSSGPISTR
jgi:hypothetical protein